jgi:hypothetical protein
MSRTALGVLALVGLVASLALPAGSAPVQAAEAAKSSFTQREREVMRQSHLPRWLKPVMLRACKHNNDPIAWVASPGLYQLLSHESSFRPRAQNPSSSAYGLFQFLNSTWAGVGGHKTSDPYLQCVYGLRYVKNRYRSPDGAWAFWRTHHWY